MDLSKAKTELMGKRFTRLVVTDVYTDDSGEIMCKCQCDCGNETVTKRKYLINSHKKSCGCFQKENREIGQIKDLTGKKFDMLTVLGIDKENSKPGLLKWKCRCDYGNIVSVIGSNLGRNNTKSCGCLNRKLTSERNFKDLTGKRFGRLVVEKLYEGPRNLKHKACLWVCKCDCGNTCIVQTGNLTNGHTQSCGCYQSDSKRTHGIMTTKDGKRISSIYNAMKARCYRPSCNSYENYGGRGIKVCDEWLSKPGDPMNTGLVNFYNWAISNGYKDGLTLDRIDNDGPYAPWNCRWTTPKEQSNNKRYNRYVVDADGEYLTFAQFEEKHNRKRAEVSKLIRHRSLNEYVYTVNHPELEMHLENKRLVDKDGFMHLIPKYNREEL